MHSACSLLDAAIFIELTESGVSIGLQCATKLLHMPLGMLAFAIRRISEPHREGGLSPATKCRLREALLYKDGETVTTGRSFLIFVRLRTNISFFLTSTVGRDYRLVHSANELASKSGGPIRNQRTPCRRSSKEAF